MKGSLQLIRIAGIPIKIHWTFGLLFLYIGFIAFREGMGISGTLSSFFLIGLVFLCVILHEYGHALTARRYGVNTRDIILSPIGGIARLEKIPDKPIQEFIIAIAGPLVNVAISIGILGTLWLLKSTLPHLFSLDFWSFEEAQPLSWIILKVNLLLIGFNIIPAFPMDGGRMARAILSARLGKAKATHIASLMGRTLAVGFVIFGIFWGNIILAVIGVFIFMAALNEYRSVMFEQVLNHYSLREVLRPLFTKLQPNDPIQKAIHLSIQGNESSFLVFDEDDRIAGVLARHAIQTAMQNNDQYKVVSEYMTDAWEEVEADADLIEVFMKFQTNGYTLLPVIDSSGRILGVVDRTIMRNLFEMGMGNGKKRKNSPTPTAESQS